MTVSSLSLVNIYSLVRLLTLNLKTKHSLEMFLQSVCINPNTVDKLESVNLKDI